MLGFPTQVVEVKFALSQIITQVLLFVAMSNLFLFEPVVLTLGDGDFAIRRRSCCMYVCDLRGACKKSRQWQQAVEVRSSIPRRTAVAVLSPDFTAFAVKYSPSSPSYPLTFNILTTCTSTTVLDSWNSQCDTVGSILL